MPPVPATRLDVIALGNAVVDVLVPVEEAWLDGNGIGRGVMTLIDEARAEALQDSVGAATEQSGGSAANTVAGLAALGGRAGFVGRVRDDRLGEVFRKDMRGLGVDFRTAPARTGAATARCFVFIAPTAQRSMNTYLGASVELGPEDVDDSAVADAGMVYLEGYLWDAPGAKAAMLKAADAARAAGRKVALTLSDPLCVERHREGFLDLVDGPVDILFANEAEITALLRCRDIAEAADAVAGKVEIAALTRGAAGSVTVSGSTRHVEPAARIDDPVDTTGAGDLYAAGFLYGLTHGYPLDACARLANRTGGEIVRQIGARPDRDFVRRAAPAR